MDLVNIAKLGALLRATIADYTILHEKMKEVMDIRKELDEATPDTYSAISKKYLTVIESYLITNSILKLQYKSLQEFAQTIQNQAPIKHPDITKAKLELMVLDMDYMRSLPSLRNAVENINEILINSGAIRDETLTMVGVVRDGEIRV
jgi:hypothetical protein